MALVRQSYDPTQVALAGDNQNRRVVPVRKDPDNDEYVCVRLTAKGNEALLQLCHTADQKTVWTFPSYEFTVRKGSLTAAQLITGRPSYVNAVLIASRGLAQRNACANNTLSVFKDQVRIPGYWGGSCAGCKWKDGSAHCSYGDKTEAKFQPTSVASLPRNIIEELED
ncbi:hypothetical protein LTR04_003706 [Oleoguttula sp. CCFEE 6159]|nr:hypothetical protein LTR04_003706 [Oleoguttula sp. CCFEE 6159]